MVIRDRKSATFTNLGSVIIAYTFGLPYWLKKIMLGGVDKYYRENIGIVISGIF